MYTVLHRDVQSPRRAPSLARLPEARTRRVCAGPSPALAPPSAGSVKTPASSPGQVHRTGQRPGHYRSLVSVWLFLHVDPLVGVPLPVPFPPTYPSSCLVPYPP